ncbi:hypothetical protein GCM10009801_79960 [Streptomyces albiaxialis]|uniref:Uncharacterized protein n=1 Tax=Streptomyces albiaxialis TaxID=329523 RepID=A0ABP5ISW3_9ACTN
MAGVLAAAVGVKDHPGWWAALMAGRARGIDDQAGAQVIGGGPAHDAGGGDVDDGSQVEPAFVGGDVGDVAAPAGVGGGRVGLEVASYQVGPGRCGRVGDRGAVLGRAVAAGEADGPCQPCDASA